KSALGDRADFVLPHPAAIRRFGDSGEVARKIKQIKRALEQVNKADPKALVEEAYAKSMKKFGEPVERHSAREVASESGRSIWRVNDGWGERYYLVEGGKARPIAVKMPDVHAFHCEPPLDKLIGKKEVKEMGWSDEAWDRALTNWLKTDVLKKANDIGEEGDTRAELAEKLYKEEWHNMYPKSGRGRFTYQMHWRGLTEEETKLSHEELLKTNHSVHGDLRFQIDDEIAWGFSVFEGDTEDIRKTEHGSRLLELPPDDSLQGQFKLFQPVEWITITDKGPYISEPGGPGSTSKTFSKFFKLDGGQYRFSFAREHGRELFLDGKYLKGRLLIQYAPMGQGRRVWLVNRPESQEPYTKAHDLADVISELKAKGQKWVIWADEPGEKPRKINVQTGRVVKEYHAAIIKADEEQRLVYGVVLEPDTVDTQGDTISADEIEAAAHRFLVKSRVVGDRHSKRAKAEVVESYIAPMDFEWGGQKVKKGSWILGVHISDGRLWQAVKKGEYTGFSVGGFGIREEVA
ncbi:MAG: hypothetical protein JRD89_04140, partial [Deltaproteobacteria bacterium]|nr:hypothetical protein [Deltaproteobacteria bacterium]